jgi:hypothetical protein
VAKASDSRKTSVAKMGEWHTASHAERQKKKRRNSGRPNP